MSENREYIDLSQMNYQENQKKARRDSNWIKYILLAIVLVVVLLMIVLVIAKIVNVGSDNKKYEQAVENFMNIYVNAMDESDLERLIMEHYPDSIKQEVRTAFIQDCLDFSEDMQFENAWLAEMDNLKYNNWNYTAFYNYLDTVTLTEEELDKCEGIINSNWAKEDEKVNVKEGYLIEAVISTVIYYESEAYAKATPGTLLVLKCDNTIGIWAAEDKTGKTTDFENDYSWIWGDIRKDTGIDSVTE